MSKNHGQHLIRTRQQRGMCHIEMINLPTLLQQVNFDLLGSVADSFHGIIIKLNPRFQVPAKQFRLLFLALAVKKQGFTFRK